MGDIFLSYAREDRERASQLAGALGAAGHDVFWDVEIPPGMSWADFLEEKLASSKAALVLWSKTSVASQWVREEARLARDRSRLIPVMLDDCAPPFGFGEIQAANLANWRGDANDPNFRLLLSSVERAVGGAGTPRPPRPVYSPPPAAPPPTPPPAAAKKISPRAWWIAGGVAVLGVLALIGVSEKDNTVTPAPLALAPVAATSQSAAVSPAVAQALEQARQIQAEAQAAIAQAGQAATQGQAAAATARAGATYGFGTLGNGTNYVAGDLATLQKGQPAAVIVQAPTNAFSGLVTADPMSGRYVRMVGANQAVNGAGSQAITTFSADASSGRQVGRYFNSSYTAEGSSEGVLATLNMAGLGVVQFSDGTRYAGQYRVVGADGHIVKQGLGALYDSGGAIVQAGRFDNDVYSGPN